MSLVKKIAYNTFIQIIGRVFSIFFGVISISLMTRYLGASGFGMYTKILTFFQIFGVLLDFGLYNVTLKLISHENDENSENIINKIITLRLILNLLFLVVPFFSLLSGYEPIVKQSIFLYSTVFLFSNLTQIVSVLLQKKLNTTPLILSELISRFVFLILVYFIYKLNLGLIAITFANIIVAIIGVLIVMMGSKKYFKIRLIADKIFWKEILKTCWPFSLSIIFNLIYFRADTFLLTILKSNTEIGIYSAAYKVLEIYITIPALFMNLILPILDQSYKNNDLDRFNRILQKVFDFFSMIVFPLIIGGLFLSKDVMLLLAGKEFSDSGTVLGILMVVMGIITMGAIYTNVIVAVNQQKKMTMIYLIAAIFSVILYLIFIPKFSYFAAAYLKIIIEGFILIASFILVYKKVKKLPSLINIPKIIGATLVMAFALFIFKTQFNFDIFITLPSAILIYFGSLFLMGGIDKEIISQVFRK